MADDEKKLTESERSAILNKIDLLETAKEKLSPILTDIKAVKNTYFTYDLGRAAKDANRWLTSYYNTTNSQKAKNDMDTEFGKISQLGQSIETFISEVESLISRCESYIDVLYSDLNSETYNFSNISASRNLYDKAADYFN